jgi:hypothetical protein
MRSKDGIIPQSYVDMRALSLRVPQNPTWREKVSYKGKTERLRDMMKQNQRLLPWDSYDYKFYTRFQQDFYVSVIIPKGTHVALSQWIDWTYMERKNDTYFDEIVAACEEKHLREIMAFQRNRNNEVIAQFYAAMFVEEHGDIRNFP